jgi:DNA-directed RNA polymerase specialized sigma subunit
MSKIDSLKKIKHRILFLSKKYGLSELESQDCASEICTRMLEGRHQHAYLDHAIIDYLRKEFNKNKVTVNNSVEYVDNFESKENNLFNKMAVNQLLKYVKGQRSKVIFGLTYIYGFDNHELAKLFQISQPRMNQLNRDIIIKIKKEINLKKLKSSIKK